MGRKKDLVHRVPPRKTRKIERTWAIEDHLCRGCSGRILRCVRGNGVTAGGNPVFKCADCGEAKASMTPHDLCWCGLRHKHNQRAAYMCLPFSDIEEHPWLHELFLQCGCDPSRSGEVGIVLVDSYRKKFQEEQEKKCETS